MSALRNSRAWTTSVDPRAAMHASTSSQKSAGTNRQRRAAPRKLISSVWPSMIDWFLPTDLHHPRRLLLVRQAAVWGELIHQVGQMLAKAGEQIVHTQAGVFAQCVDGVAAEHVRQIIWCDLVVRTVADPGLCDMAMPALLEFFY